MKPRRLTAQEEDQLLIDDQTRKNHGIKQLCAKYNVCETTLREALKRAKERRKPAESP